MYERMEIQSLLSVYGDDVAIQALAKFWKSSIAFVQEPGHPPPDLAAMILRLQKSLFRDSIVTKEDIQHLINR